MPYDIAELFARIVSLVADERPISVRMQSLIDYCASAHLYPSWPMLCDISFDADTSRAVRWLSGFAKGAPPALKARGLWFGLNNPIVDGMPGADIYVASGPYYASDNIDWALELNYAPPARYLRSQVLSEIYAISYSGVDPLGNDAEYPLNLAYGGIITAYALSAFKLPPPLDQVAGAAMGYDSGDCLYLGEFHDGTLKLAVRAG